MCRRRSVCGTLCGRCETVALAGRHDSFPSGRGLACRAETDVALTLSSVLRSAFARRAFVAGCWAPRVGEVTSRRKGTFLGGDVLHTQMPVPVSQLCPGRQWRSTPHPWWHRVPEAPLAPHVRVNALGQWPSHPKVRALVLVRVSCSSAVRAGDGVNVRKFLLEKDV